MAKIIQTNSTEPETPPNGATTIYVDSLTKKLTTKDDTGTVVEYGQDVEYFETVSKNLKSWGASFNYSGGNLSSIVYTDGVDTITKTFNYTGDSLTSIVLGGDTPSGIELTKTLGYTSGNLTSVTYF
jgi:hypothetical protein